jgi:hypothetical protein
MSSVERSLTAPPIRTRQLWASLSDLLLVEITVALVPDATSNRSEGPSSRMP